MFQAKWFKEHGPMRKKYSCVDWNKLIIFPTCYWTFPQCIFVHSMKNETKDFSITDNSVSTILEIYNLKNNKISWQCNGIISYVRHHPNSGNLIIPIQLSRNWCQNPLKAQTKWTWIQIVVAIRKKGMILHPIKKWI